MNDKNSLKLLFIINPGAGNNSTNWQSLIQDHFKSLNHSIHVFELPPACDLQKIKEKIAETEPDSVIAVGGDGTVKLIAECVMLTKISLGILPNGSANGLAKELGIPEDPHKAMNVILDNSIKKIHLLKINEELCIHLSDIGFNAYVIKKAKQEKKRGMWNYIKASWKVLWDKPHMFLEIHNDKSIVKKEAAMVVLANGKSYGSGAVINPEGKLDDHLFEVIIVKKVSGTEIFKMMVTHQPYNPAKTELFQTSSVEIRSRHKVHFQVDGEYLGKIKDIRANIITDALKIIVPVL